MNGCVFREGWRKDRVVKGFRHSVLNRSFVYMTAAKHEKHAVSMVAVFQDIN